MEEERWGDEDKTVKRDLIVIYVDDIGRGNRNRYGERKREKM